MNMKTALQCTLLAMLLSSVSAVAATIVPDDDVPARRVNFADLNLTRSEGAAVLYARINAAARDSGPAPICSRMSSDSRSASSGPPASASARS